MVNEFNEYVRECFSEAGKDKNTNHKSCRNNKCKIQS